MSAWVYAGLLDDAFQRYDDNARMNNEAFFVNQLLRQVFFGDPILLNDGYVFSAGGLAQLMDAKSLLRSLMSTGFVKVLTRAGELDVESFCSIPEKQALLGQETAKRLVARSDFTDIKAKIASFAKLANAGHIERFPNRKIHEGFHKLFRRISDKHVEDIGIFGMTSGMWHDFAGEVMQKETFYPFPRDTVEKSILALKSSGIVSPSAVDSVMAVANQAYHYNFALCLSAEMKIPIAADTTIGRAFDELIDFDQTIDIDPGSWQDAPAISIPSDFPVNKFELIREFVVPGTDINTAKSEFLEGAQLALSSHSSELELRIKIKEHFDTYRTKIALHLADQGYRPKTEFTLQAAAGAALSMSLNAYSGSLGLMQTWAPVAAGLVNWPNVFEHMKKLHGLKGIMTHAKRIPVELNRRFVEASFKGMDGRRSLFVYSGVAFNRTAAEMHVADVPKFN